MEEDKSKQNSMMPYLAIIAIIAIVAVVGMLTLMNSRASVAPADNAIRTSDSAASGGNVAGQARMAFYQNATIGRACYMRDSSAFSWGQCPAGYDFAGGMTIPSNINVATYEQNYWHPASYIWWCC